MPCPQPFVLLIEKTVADSLGVDHPTIIHGPLSRRGTRIETLIAGNPANTIRSSLTDKYVFEIHLSLDTLITMFIHIKQCDSNKERSIQLTALYKVLEFLVIPNECYHSYFENYFDVVTDVMEKNLWPIVFLLSRRPSSFHWSI